MKVACLQENLTKGLAVAGAANSRASLPVLSHVLLATDQGRLRIVATDLEVTVTAWIGARVDEEGAIAVPARVLADFVKAMPPERVDMDLNAKTSTLALKCSRFHANVKGIEASEFPVQPEPDGAKFKIEPDMLADAIDAVAFAAAKDEARPVLAGVYVEMGKSARFSGADGYRLSVRTADLVDGAEAGAGKGTAKADPNTNAIVPLRALEEVKHFLGGEEDPVQIYMHTNRVDFVGASWRVQTQVIEGVYPDMKKIIPSSHKTRVVVATGDLKDAVAAATVFAREGMGAVYLQVDNPGEMGESVMAVTGTSAESGDAKAVIECTSEGNAVAIAFNSHYLKDALGAIKSPQVAFELTGDSGVAAVKPVGTDGLVMAMMPMHVK